MTPYYQNELVTIYNADCMDVLPELDPVDLVLTDPPYEQEAHTKNRRTLTHGGISHREVVGSALPFDAMNEDLRLSISKDCHEISHGWGLYFCQAEAIAIWKECLESAGAIYKRACVWIKPDGMPQFSGDRPGMGYESFVAVWHGKGRSIWNGGGKHGVYTFTKHDRGHGHGGISNRHPTQKPLQLIEQLVLDFSNERALILDPFLGSGTTAVAAIKLNRKCIGIELREPYCEIAAKRCEQFKTGLSPAEQEAGQQTLMGSMTGGTSTSFTLTITQSGGTLAGLYVSGLGYGMDVSGSVTGSNIWIRLDNCFDLPGYVVNCYGISSDGLFGTGTWSDNESGSGDWDALKQ